MHDNIYATDPVATADAMAQIEAQQPWLQNMFDLLEEYIPTVAGVQTGPTKVVSGLVARIHGRIARANGTTKDYIAEYSPKVGHFIPDNRDVEAWAESYESNPEQVDEMLKQVNAGETAFNNDITDITLTPSDIDEDSSIGTVVGTLAAVDADAGDTHTFELVSDPDSKFEIVGDQLKTIAALDYETKTSHNIDVKATDTGDSTLTKSLIVTVNDIVEATYWNGVDATFIDIVKTQWDMDLTAAGTTHGSVANGEITAADYGSSHVAALTSISSNAISAGEYYFTTDTEIKLDSNGVRYGPLPAYNPTLIGSWSGLYLYVIDVLTSSSFDGSDNAEIGLEGTASYKVRFYDKDPR